MSNIHDELHELIKQSEQLFNEDLTVRMQNRELLDGDQHMVQNISDIQIQYDQFQINLSAEEQPGTADFQQSIIPVVIDQNSNTSQPRSEDQQADAINTINQYNLQIEEEEKRREQLRREALQLKEDKKQQILQTLDADVRRQYQKLLDAPKKKAPELPLQPYQKKQQQKAAEQTPNEPDDQLELQIFEDINHESQMQLLNTELQQLQKKLDMEVTQNLNQDPDYKTLITELDKGQQQQMSQQQQQKLQKDPEYSALMKEVQRRQLQDYQNYKDYHQKVEYLVSDEFGRELKQPYGVDKETLQQDDVVNRKLLHYVDLGKSENMSVIQSLHTDATGTSLSLSKPALSVNTERMWDMLSRVNVQTQLQAEESEGPSIFDNKSIYQKSVAASRYSKNSRPPTVPKPIKQTEMVNQQYEENIVVELEIPTIKGQPDFLREQKRDRVLKNWESKIDKCIEFVHDSKEVEQLSKDQFKQLFIDYMSNNDAIDTSFDTKGNILLDNQTEQSKLADLLQETRQQAEKMIDEGAYADIVEIDVENRQVLNDIEQNDLLVKKQVEKQEKEFYRTQALEETMRRESVEDQQNRRALESALKGATKELQSQKIRGGSAKAPAQLSSRTSNRPLSDSQKILHLKEVPQLLPQRK